MTTAECRLNEQNAVRISRTGMLVSNHNGPTVCIVQPNHRTYSETFIANHIAHLPAKVKVLCCGWFPTRDEDGRRLVPLPLWAVCRGIWKMSGSMNPLATRFANGFLKRYLEAQHVQVVLAEYGRTAAMIQPGCVAAGVPLVVHFHGFDAYEYATLREFGAAYRRFFIDAAAIIAGSQAMTEQLVRLGAPRERLYCNPSSGVDPELFCGARPETAPAVFIGVGSFVEKKAPHLTLRAFHQVHEVHPDARLILIGTGPLLAPCRALAEELGIAEAVSFAGPKSPSQVAALMRTARAFVQHSVRAASGDSEGTAITPLEAGMSSLPVVSTRHGGIPESVIHDKTGFLVEEGDVLGMAKYMVKLAENPLLAGEMGHEARRHIEANFSLESSISNLWKILQQAIQEKNRA